MANAVTERGCALITGGSRGIGAAIATELAAAGWAVGVNYVNDLAAAEAVVEAIRSDGGRAAAIGADIRDPDAAARLLTTVKEEFGLPALVLVNNAAVLSEALVPEMDDRTWDRVIGTNLTAAFRLTRGALRAMMSNRFGRVVNVASVAARSSYPGQSAYAASKAGLIAFTRTTAREVARLSITVNAVVPGLIETDASQPSLARLTEEVPAGRPGRPAEVAACVRFLASEEASYVTGSVLTVDGGLTS